MTESEKDTIRLFNDIKVNLVRIPEGVEKTPDFFVETDKQKIFIEVKEINENEEEKGLLKEIDKKGHVSGDSPEIGKRFRPSIRAANKQLKKSCTSNEAGLVIIQDVRHFFTRSCIPQEEIKLAMFCDRVTWLGVNSGKVQADLFDKNKTTTEQKNTTISAVGLMIKNVQDDSLTLHIYHNPHAKTPLMPPVFESTKVFEYCINTIKVYDNFEIQ
jgi:hypothetical protein